jgi:NADH:ubiquinone oxidoreductase subunit 3 (subunit A)
MNAKKIGSPWFPENFTLGMVALFVFGVIVIFLLPVVAVVAIAKGVKLLQLLLKLIFMGIIRPRRTYQELRLSWQRRW